MSTAARRTSTVMTSLMRLALLAYTATCLVAASPEMSYSLEDPKADHTEMANSLIGKGDQEGAYKSFEAAHKHKKDGVTLLNFGVATLNVKRDVKAAEKLLLEAWSVSRSYEEQQLVTRQLDVKLLSPPRFLSSNNCICRLT